MAAPPLAAVLKRQEEAAPELLALVRQLAADEFDALLPKLCEWSVAPWNRPRGDLCHWRVLLERLHGDLSNIVSQYDFDSDVPAVLSPEHESTVEIILKFSATLTENCANRVVYPSMPILKKLVEAANVKVVAATLMLMTKFLPRKGSNFAATAQLIENVNEQTIVRLCTIVPTHIGPQHCELQDFYELSFTTPAAQAHAIQAAELGWAVDTDYLQNRDMADIYRDAAQQLPPQMLQGLRYRVWLACGLAGNAEVRKGMIFAQCYATACCIYILESARFTATVLSRAPSTIHAIAKLVNQDDDRLPVPELRLLGLHTLQHICFDHESIGMSVLRRCNNLGIISILPGITKAARAGEPIDEAFITRLFGLLRYTSMGNLVSVGLGSLALDFVAVDSLNYLRPRTACVSFLNSLVMEVPAANTAFIEANGVEVLLRLLEREVDLERVATLTEQAPDYCIADHTLSLDRVRWICSAVVLLANLLTLRRSSLLLTKLLDSNLLTICQRLIAHPGIFSGRNAALALDLVVALIRQDENTFQVLQDRNLLSDMVLNAQQLSEPKFRQYPAALAFYVAVAALVPAENRTQSGLALDSSVTKLFTMLSQDMIQTPMFTFRQIGRAAFGNLGASTTDRICLLQQLSGLYKSVLKTLSSKMTENWDPILIYCPSEGSQWYATPESAYALEALVHLTETSLEEPPVMASFLNSDGYMDFLRTLVQSPHPYDFSERAVGKTRLYRLFRRMYQMSADRDAFAAKNIEYLGEIASSLLRQIKASGSFKESPSGKEQAKLTWALSSFCFAIQLLSRMLFLNTRSAFRVMYAINPTWLAVNLAPLLETLGEIHRWALTESAAWITALEPAMELATNPISARRVSDMGPGIGLSYETTAADTDFVERMFNELPADQRQRGQLVKAQRWLCARTHLLCTEFMGNLAMYSSADSLVEQDLKYALIASKKVADIYLESVCRAMRDSDGIEARHAALFLLIDLRTILINDRRLLNLGTFIMFVQSGGMRELLRLIKRLLLSKRGPESTSIYLAEGCHNVDLYDESVIFAMDKLTEFVANMVTMSDPLYSSELCVHSLEADEPEYFSLAQFFVELRIGVLVDLRKEFTVEYWTRLPPLALESLRELFEAAFAEVPLDADEMALPGTELERERLPLLFDPENIIGSREKAAALHSTGKISVDDALKALREHDDSVRLVCQALNLPLPPESLFEREQTVGEAPVLNGRKYTVIEDLIFLRKQWTEWIHEYALAVVDNNEATAFYAAGIVSQLAGLDYEESETNSAPMINVTDPLVDELARGTISKPRLHFLAVLAGSSFPAQDFRSRLIQSLDQLAALVTGPDQSKVAFAATLMEWAITDHSMMFDAVAQWTDRRAPLFVESFTHLCRIEDDVANIAVARLILVLSWLTTSYELSLGVMRSGLVAHFLKVISRLQGNISGQQLQTVVILLLRSIVESPDVQSRVMESSLAKELMQEFPRAVVDEVVQGQIELFGRNPQLMFDVCVKNTFYDERNEVLHLRLVYEKYAKHLNEYIRKRKYRVDLVPPTPEPKRGPTLRGVPKPEVGEVVHFVLRELIAQPYEEVFSRAKKYVQGADKDETAKDLNHPDWLEFRHVANYMNFLLVALFELCDVSEIARQAMLFYPQDLSTIPSDLAAMPDQITPALPFLLQVVCAFANDTASIPNICIPVAERLARVAGQIIYSLTYMAAESFVDKETVQIRRARTMYLSHVCVALLEHHFGFSSQNPPLFPHWSSPCRIYRLLGSIVSIMVLILKQNTLEWQSVEPKPFIALAVIESGLPDLVARCLCRSQLNDPVIADAREDIYAFFATIASYGALDVDSKFPVPVGEPVLVLESQSEEPSVFDLFAGDMFRGFGNSRHRLFSEPTPADAYEVLEDRDQIDDLDTRMPIVASSQANLDQEDLSDSHVEGSDADLLGRSRGRRQNHRELLRRSHREDSIFSHTRSSSPGVEVGGDSDRDDRMLTEDEDSNRTDPLFSNPELESWASDLDRAEDDAYLSYENVSDEDAASLGSEETHDSLDGQSELDQNEAGDEEMYSDDELEISDQSEMDIELVLEPVTDMESEDGSEEYSDYSGFSSDELSGSEPEARGRSTSETSGAAFAEDSTSPQSSARASILAQLYAHDFDDYDTTDEESADVDDAFDNILDEDTLNLNSLEFEARPLSSNHNNLTHSAGLGGLINGLVHAEESPRAFSRHPNFRENYLDMVIYRLDDGEAYHFTYDDIDLEAYKLRHPLHVEPHLLIRATDCVLGGDQPSICANISPLQAGVALSTNPTCTTFMDFGVKRTRQRWETYSQYAALPKRSNFVRGALDVLLQAAHTRIDVNNAYLDALYHSADAVWEIEAHNNVTPKFFDMTDNLMNLEDETENFITSDDIVWGSDPVVVPRASISRPWDYYSEKYSSATVWSTSLSLDAVYCQLRLLFAPWPTSGDAELMCQEIASMPWDLFHAFIQGLYRILETTSHPQGGLIAAFTELAPREIIEGPAYLGLKALESTSSERVVYQTLFLLLALNQTPKFRTFLATNVPKNSHDTINLLLGLVDREMFLSDSVLLERLLLLIHHIVRVVVRKLKEKGNLGVSEIVSQANLQRLMLIWTTPECTSNAFRSAVESVGYLSQLADVKGWVNHQLMSTIKEWISRMINELEHLKTHSEPEERLISRITSYTSVQAMLLRLLTVVRLNSRLDTSEVVSTLLGQKVFEPLIDKLDEVLTTRVSESDQFTRIASLRPLIESLVLVGKVSTTRGVNLQDGVSFRQSIFGFIEHHSALFNQLVYKNSTQLLNDSVTMLEDSMQLLTFENRKLYFANRMSMVRQLSQRTTVPLRVPRTNMFEQSMQRLMKLPPEDLRAAHIEVHFDGEEGIDQGGLNREWYSEMAKAIFRPESGLFEQLGTGLHPKHSVEKNLDKFLFIGRFIGKAMFDGQLLDVGFSLPVYKYLLHEQITFEDLKVVDEEYYNSLKWMLENDITDVIDEVFAMSLPDLPDTQFNLIPNGANIQVTESNKAEYVQLRALWKLLNGAKPQLKALKRGFYEVMDASLVKLFSPKELELVISGIPKIDITDWRLNTEYDGYAAASPQIRWFWRAVKSFDHSERAMLLQFCTGSAKVPIDGFEHLPAGKFNISRDRQSPDRLPTSHTCTNHLVLPEYMSYDILRAALVKAMLDGAGSFGLA